MNQSSTEPKFPQTLENLQLHYLSKIHVAEMATWIPQLFHVPVTMGYKAGKMVYDMNTNAKSHLHLVHTLETGEVEWVGRYDRVFDIDTAYDLLYAVKECMCGRPAVNSQWLRAMEHYGVISVHRYTVEKVII